MRPYPDEMLPAVWASETDEGWTCPICGTALRQESASGLGLPEPEAKSEFLVCDGCMRYAKRAK